MSRRSLILAVIFMVAIAGAGYFLGAFLQAPGEVLAAIQAPTAHAQAAPMPISPANGSEFVDSDIMLAWSWAPGLADSQLYALRVWAEDRPRQEVWTEDSRVSVAEIIDSFSLAFGRFYWQVSVVNLSAEGRYRDMGSEWSDIAELQRLRRPRVPAQAYADMSDTARHFHDLGLSASQLIDAVHLFIHRNSKTNEQRSYLPDYSDAVDIMYAHFQGESAEMPRLLCDGRSTAMLTVLKELGIESRLIFLYKSGRGWISQHTVLEVFNPDIQYWQIHDVADDFYVLHEPTGIRVNAKSILFDSHDELVGCPVDGGPCSAELAAESLAYFEALRYGHTFEVWVNPDRFDLSGRFGGQADQNLAEFIGKGDPQRVSFRMDSWLESP